MTQDQNACIEFLERIGGRPLAGLFETLVVICVRKDLPSRAVLVAHLGREILNGVVRQLAGQDSKFELWLEIPILRDVLQPLLAMRDLQVAYTPETFDLPSMLTTPRLIHGCAEWFDRLDRNQSFPKRIVSAYDKWFENDDRTAPIVAPHQFFKLHEFLVGKVHFGEGQSVLSDDEIDESLAKLELVLAPFASSLVKILLELDEILQNANALGD